MVACLCVAMITTGNEFEIKIFAASQQRTPKQNCFPDFLSFPVTNGRKFGPSWDSRAAQRGGTAKRRPAPC